MVGRGSSGIAQVRSYGGGGRDYHEASYSNAGILSIHNHANNIRTIGMGEFTAVLNGVTFSTRHNDYRLRMAPTNDKTYGRLVDVPFPEVPPRVLNSGSVSQQTAEMKEWFRAWQAQEPTKAGPDGVVRDYRPYFKPVLCVLEGAWITDNGNLDEPFYSDRHHIEAKDWADLHDKVQILTVSVTCTCPHAPLCPLTHPSSLYCALYRRRHACRHDSFSTQVARTT